MQIYNFGSWRNFISNAIAWVISGALIIALSVAALWILNKVVGEASFSALTLLVAIVGAVTAVTQTRSTATEGLAERARALAFASGLARDAIQLLSRPLPRDYQGEIVNPCLLEPGDAGQRSATLEQMVRAADQIDLANLPSAYAMAAVVKLRAALQLASMRMQARLATGNSVDMEDSFVDLALVSEELGKERDRLYPTYKIGNSLVQSSGVERR